MEMIDSKSLFYTAHRLLKEVEATGNPENWNFKKIDVQKFISSDDTKYILMVCVKPAPENFTDSLEISQDVNKEELINAAQELINAEPRPTAYDFFKKDVQEFRAHEKKFILGLALRAYDEGERSLEV